MGEKSLTPSHADTCSLSNEDVIEKTLLLMDQGAVRARTKPVKYAAEINLTRNQLWLQA